MSTAESVYFRNCDTPTLSAVNGNVKGKIPEWLKGTLIRNGPGIKIVGEDVFNHAFDGMAVLHRFHIENGKATYSNRPLESEQYRMNMESQRIVVSSFGTNAYADPCEVLFAKFKTEFRQDGSQTRDNCNVNVCYYGDQLYAMTESQTVRRIDPETLRSIGDGTILNDYAPIDTASAHPHVLEDGTAINVGQHYTHKKGPHYTCISIPPSFDSSESSFTKAKLIVEIPAQHPGSTCYFHSFGITKDKLIFIEQPLRFNLQKMMANRTQPLENRVTIAECLEWDEEAKTRFHVASLKTGEIHPIVYETSQLFTLHHINAYEEEGHLIVDVSGYNTGGYVTDDMFTGTIHKISNSGCTGRRYILPLDINNKDGNLISLKNTTATASIREGNAAIVDVTPHVFYNQFFEFPRINYKFNGQPYKYIYGVTTTKAKNMAPSFPEPNTIVKVNFESNHTLSWHEENVITPEPIFVANPTAENGAEDDGVILCPLLYSDDLMKTTLLILDAKEFKEIARVDFKAIGTIPGSFHGQWANTADKTHFY